MNTTNPIIASTTSSQNECQQFAPNQTIALTDRKITAVSHYPGCNEHGKYQPYMPGDISSKKGWYQFKNGEWISK